MKMQKIQLLTATAVSLFTATGAQATVTYPSAEIHGNGASSIINVLDKTWGCLAGPDTEIGFADGTTKNFPDHHYYPTTPTTSNPTYHCDTQSIQANLTGHYVSTGSGNGKKNWKNFSQADIGTLPASFTTAYADGHIQYAFSDSPISAGDLTTYNSTATTSPASHGAGPAIQVPFYVLPIAIAYPKVYGKKNIGGVPTPLAFNVKSTFVQHAGDGTVTGGLRMKKSTYCKILNGTITNWNDAALKADNGGQSLGDTNDPDFDTTGVPIVLIGRGDKSGTSNLFTRHLDALGNSTAGDANIAGCAGARFDTGAGGKDRLDDVAGVDNAQPAIYDKATGVLLTAGSSYTFQGGTADAKTYTVGAEAAGKFGLADGSDGVADAIGQGVPDSEVPNPGDRSVHGYLGYVGADFVLPATLGTTTPEIYAAALQVGTGSSYNMPTATNATAAFSTTYLPPQANSNGTYNPAVTANGMRNDPLAWVLPSTANDKLANPAKGYPITGTTNLLLYTCYNTYQKRAEVVALGALQFGKLGGTQTTDASGHFPVAIVNSTAKGVEPGHVGLQIGILARNGLANLPGPWKTAVWETFFAKISSGNNPGSLNLWIQDKLPTSTALIDGNSGNGEVVSNPTCTAGQGS